MRKVILLSVLLSFSVLDVLPQSFQRCSIFDLLEEQIYTLGIEVDSIRDFKKEFLAKENNQFHRGKNESIIIPIVIHILWRTQQQNLSNEQIYEQINIINQDFRALNSNIDIVPDEFRQFIADTNIEFCLASIDPCGNPVTGITRTNTDLSPTLSRDIFYSSKGGKDAWSPEYYLNVWVADIGSTLGASSEPLVSPLSEDGVIINYRVFGPNVGAFPYNLGRTLTHEIGHYFNLNHLWEDGDCNYSDDVEDTPNQSKDYVRECPTKPQFTCGSSDMYMNYMNYTDDACMAMFTLGQKERMLNSLYNFRENLITSSACNIWSVPPGNDYLIYPNPAIKNELFITFNFEDMECKREIMIYDISGRLIKKITVDNTNEPIDISNLPSGTYIMRISDNSKIFPAKRFIISR